MANPPLGLNNLLNTLKQQEAQLSAQLTAGRPREDGTSPLTPEAFANLHGQLELVRAQIEELQSQITASNAEAGPRMTGDYSRNASRGPEG